MTDLMHRSIELSKARKSVTLPDENNRNFLRNECVRSRDRIRVLKLNYPVSFTRYLHTSYSRVVRTEIQQRRQSFSIMLGSKQWQIVSKCREIKSRISIACRYELTHSSS